MAPFRILSLDGGGIRGIIPALVLAELERRTDRRTAQQFDLIAGTSTGGILALGLTRPGPDRAPLYSADEMVSLYVKDGGKIFDRGVMHRLKALGNLADEKYASDGIDAVLEERFGAALLAGRGPPRPKSVSRADPSSARGLVPRSAGCLRRARVVRVRPVRREQPQLSILQQVVAPWVVGQPTPSTVPDQRPAVGDRRLVDPGPIRADNAGIPKCCRIAASHSYARPDQAQDPANVVLGGVVQSVPERLRDVEADSAQAVDVSVSSDMLRKFVKPVEAGRVKIQDTARARSNTDGASRGQAPRAAVCTLRVDGMDCSSCAESVEKALHQLDGVGDVRVDVVGGRVTVEYGEGKLARGDLMGAIDRIGYRVKDEAPVRKEVFEVDGMDCADEVRLIEGRLGSLPGVSRLGFNLVDRRLTVEGEIAAAEIESAVASLGMRARLVGEERAIESWWQRRGRLGLAAISGVLWALSLGAEHLLDVEPAAAAFAIGAIVAGGWYIVPRGIRAAMNRALDMNFLMSIAALGALLIGEYVEAATAMFLFAVAQLLETYSMDRARNAINALMDLSPAEATVLRDGREVRIPVDAVRVGETVVVRPGEKIPVDGEVVVGASSVNQAPITGEAMPVAKSPGAEVFAGTLNGEGALEVRSAKPASGTTLRRIIHSVEEAQASRAPSQSFVDRFARVYTPAVVATAIAVALFPPLAGVGEWGEWFYRALVLLVVACPCALVISTPVTIVSALAGAARQGILIKGGLHLENAGRARVVAIDKTGTLTEGEPAVVEIIALDGTDPRDVLSHAATAEARSQHPIARAILRRALEEHIPVDAATETTAIIGQGLTASVGAEIVYVGNERLFRRLGASLGDARHALETYEMQGRTAVLVGTVPAGAIPETGPVLTGVIAIADRVRPQAAAALRDLHHAGIERIVMLTGDNAGTATAVERSLGGSGVGVDESRAELLPDDKVAVVRDLRDATVLMVGDGVNDAPALAAADVGVAMGTAGTDVALETADIALMADDLSKLPVTIRFARKAEGIIRANIALSLLTKAGFVVLAVLGVATLWMAVLADMGASLLVIMNGLRALRA